MDNKSNNNSEKEKKQVQEIGYIKPREIVEEMKDSYIDYAMSVIVSRALPDVRDGLKPVHRRILYTMMEEGLRHNVKFRKSATVVGSCLGRYHPHGDIAVYDSLVRMAQDFSLRYPLVQGQGNFGCFTKDTKVKLTDGRSLNFAELIKEQKHGKKHWTFSFNSETKKIEIAEVKNPRLTRKNEKIMEVVLDNGEKIKCTLDHRFMTRDGNYEQAKNLKPKDSLMPLYSDIYDGKKDKNLKGYERILQPIQNIWEFTHHLADAWNLKTEVYQKTASRIRHHKNFNKLDNNPDNILRIQWQDHWKFHKEIASERHKNNPEYVKNIAEGRKKYWANEENKKKHSILQSERNKKMWKNPKYRMAWIAARKKVWENPEYKEFMRKAASENLKRLWGQKSFQALISKLKSEEMKKRWQNEDFRNKQIEKTRKMSLKLWSNPAHRKYISEKMTEIFKNPQLRKRQKEISKALWQNPEYRARYSTEHFIKMGRKAWENPEFRKRQTEKAKKQWQNSEFRKNFITGVIAANKKRIEKNPNFMKELAQKAKISLRKNWKNSDYKKRIIRNKILGYVYNLSKKHSRITPDIYNKERYNNCFPKFENAVKYFDDFPEILDKAQKYNHKVVATKILTKREDVYDLTTEPCHNFLLDAGVFVHNSIDADPAAASRYTEARMSKIGEEMLKNIEKETVNFRDNYDATRKEPVVLPSPVPQLLLNGTLGIAVGMATNIPPHNLTEVVDATIYLVDNPKADTPELFKIIKGPDFPGGGMIYNQKEIMEAYSVGKGPIESRGKAEIIEDEKGRNSILITEIPYQVQKSGLVQQIANLVQDKRIVGVKTVRDESDREGMRVVIELQRDAFPQKILNRLYKFSDLQKTFHLNMLALADGIQPKVLSLSEVLTYFVEHKKQVVIRRTQYDLKKARERAHILEGLHKCLSKIDAVIKTIKASKNREDAQKNLIKKFKLTEIQATAILEMKLANLAKLERQRIEDELKEKEKMIKEFTELLKSPKKIKDLMKKELREAKETFGDERRTRVYAQKIGEIAEEDLIPQEETVITLTRGGYIKRVNPNIYKIQKRGGKGIMGMKTLGEDIIEHFISCQTHDSLLFFTDSGKVFKVPAYEIPEGSRVAKGRGILNFLEITIQEKILSVFSLGEEDEKLGIKYLAMATKNGIIKRTELNDFKNVRKSGLIAITLKKGDSLRTVCKSAGKDEIILVTKQGQSIRFLEKNIRPMSRIAAGNIGIRLKKGDELIGMNVIKEKTENYLLALMENGYGKRTNLKEYRLQGRGGSGIKAANVTEKTGGIKTTKILTGKEEDLIVISQKGQVIKTPISSVPKLGRPTQGVKIMRLDKGDKVASAACM